MYKVDFYTLKDLGHGPEAHWVHGYGDGTKLFYYRTGKHNQYAWAAVHCENGLALCFGATRAEALRKSRDPALQARASAFLRSPMGEQARKTYAFCIAKADSAAWDKLRRCE